jgi:hypothetical protein
MQFIDMDAEFQTKLPNKTAIVYGSSIAITAEGGAPRLTSEVSAAGGEFGRAERDSELTEERIYVVPSEAQRPRLATQIIIPSATVLHVGDFDLEEKGVADVEAPEATEATVEGEVAPVEEAPPDNITLIVTPQEAVNLTYLLDSGVDISLALRSAGDSTVIDTETATLQYFLDDYSIPLPGKLPYGLAPRVDSVPDPDTPAPAPAPAQ